VVSPNFAEDGLLLAGTMQDGIFRSTNRGSTWSGWNFGLFDPNINALAISPSSTNDQTILAGTQSGVFRSINGGRSWSDFDFPIDSAPVLSLAVGQNNAMYAGTEVDGLFLSQDDGKTWNQLISGTVDQIIVGNGGVMMIRQDDDILISKDSGKSWEKQTGLEADSEITCLAAPLGLRPGHPIFAGLYNGKVVSSGL
jgi:photosystem II stability/assembly factor-like uncharacterized protein